jgi:dienelactone hydrolase
VSWKRWKLITSSSSGIGRSRVVFRALAAFALAAVTARSAPETLPDIAGATNVPVPGVGVMLGGYLFQPSMRKAQMPALLLLHGNPGSAEDLEPAARNLAERGYVALALSMRGFPGSGGQDDCGARQADDAVEALHWLARQPGVDRSRLGVLGYGQGAQVALLAAARSSLLRAVVAYSPITDVARWAQTTAYQPARDYVTQVCQPHGLSSVSPLFHSPTMSAPVLLIHGAADDRVPPSQSELMHEALQGGGRFSELHLLPEVGHELTDDELEQTWPWVAGFLARNQMLSLAARTAEQQTRVNTFTERGWVSRLGHRGIKTIRELGPVKREIVTKVQNPHVDGRTDEIREFFLRGLYVRALFPGGQHSAYLLQQVEISKARWRARYGLNLGTTRETLEEKLGQPDAEQDGFLEYFHSMGIGTARIYLDAGRIVKLAWEFPAD